MDDSWESASGDEARQHIQGIEDQASFVMAPAAVEVIRVIEISGDKLVLVFQHERGNAVGAFAVRIDWEGARTLLDLMNTAMEENNPNN